MNVFSISLVIVGVLGLDSHHGDSSGRPFPISMLNYLTRINDDHHLFKSHRPVMDFIEEHYLGTLDNHTNDMTEKLDSYLKNKDVDLLELNPTMIEKVHERQNQKHISQLYRNKNTLMEKLIENMLE